MDADPGDLCAQRPPGAGSTVSTPAHRAALEAVVLSQFSAARPCDRKANRPPVQAALTERAALLGAEGLEPAVDLEQLAEVIRLAFPTAAPAAAGNFGNPQQPTACAAVFCGWVPGCGPDDLLVMCRPVPGCAGRSVRVGRG